MVWPANAVTWLSFYDAPLAAIAREIDGPTTLATYAAILTGGGPVCTPETPAVRACVEALHYYDLGERAAIGTISLVALAVTVKAVVLLTRAKAAQ